MTEERKSELYADFSEKVLRYVFGKVGDPDTAEDICADIFLKVYEKLDTYDETKAALSTWIFTIARNSVTDHFRTRRVNVELPEEMTEDFSVESEICNNETLETLASALEKLDERERDVIIMHYYAGRTLREIAETMRISYSYVKVLHHKALGALKKYF